jgi:hypothetical protein
MVKLKGKEKGKKESIERALKCSDAREYSGARGESAVGGKTGSYDAS